MVCKKHAHAPRLLTWHQPYRVVSTPLWWLFKKGAVNSASHSFKIRCDKSVGSVRLFVPGKECYIKATKRVLHKSDQKSATQKATNNNNNSFFKNNSNTFFFLSLYFHHRICNYSVTSNIMFDGLPGRTTKMAWVSPVKPSCRI